MDQCIPHVLRGSANLPALVIALHNYTLLRCYRFLPALRSAVLHDHPVRFRVERIRKDEEGRLQSVASSCKRAGIRRRRTTPVKAATPRAAMAFTLRDALAILWSLMMILRFPLRDVECILIYLCSCITELSSIIFFSLLYAETQTRLNNPSINNEIA